MRRLTPQAVWDGVRSGIFLPVGYLTQLIGLQTITASRSAFITSTALVMVPFVAYFVLRTMPGFGEVAGVVLAFVGLLFFYADAGFSLRAGDLWTLSCALAFAFQIVYTNVAARRTDALTVAIVQSLVAAVAGWGMLAWRHGGLHVAWGAVPWATMIYLSVLATALILALQAWALGRTSPVRAGVIYTLEPVFAAAFAMTFFAERMHGREVLGSAVILAGVLAAEVWRPRRESFQDELQGGSFT